MDGGIVVKPPMQLRRRRRYHTTIRRPCCTRARKRPWTSTTASVQAVNQAHRPRGLRTPRYTRCQQSSPRGVAQCKGLAGCKWARPRAPRPLRPARMAARAAGKVWRTAFRHTDTLRTRPATNNTRMRNCWRSLPPSPRHNMLGAAALVPILVTAHHDASR